MPIGVWKPLATMPISLRKNAARGTVGLDIDGRYLAAVQVSDGRIEKAASTELPEGIVRDGEVADPEALAAALKDFAAMAGLPKSVRLGVSNQQIVVRLLELPVIEDQQERDAAVRFEAADAIAMPLDEAILDHQIAGAGGFDNGVPRMRIVVVAARRTMIDGFVAAAKSAGLKPAGIDLDAFALVRMLAEGSPSGDAARVFCHLGGVTNLAVAVGEACLFARPLSGSSGTDTAASELADEIRLSIDYYMTQPQAQPVDQVVFSGPGARDDALIESLSEHLGLPTLVAEPLGSIDAAGLAGDEDPYRYTVAAGLALGAAA